MPATIVRGASDALLELFVPTRCAGCEYPGVLLCPECLSRLERIRPERACPRCGAPECSVRCHECRDREFPFGGARAAVVFDGPAPRMVVLHKDASERRLSGVIAELMVPAVQDWADWADGVVGVPASPAAVVRRGYDHGADLAAALADRLGLARVKPLRCTTRRDQRGLGRGARAANVGFTCEPPTPSGLAVFAGAAGRRERARLLPLARVLLVDDVFTTGATTAAAAAALLEAGTEEVRVAAFARVLRA
jgi:predicted amidophosphoribosyltransferase